MSDNKRQLPDTNREIKTFGDLKQSLKYERLYDQTIDLLKKDPNLTKTQIAKKLGVSSGKLQNAIRDHLDINTKTNQKSEEETKKEPSIWDKIGLFGSAIGVTALISNPDKIHKINQTLNEFIGNNQILSIIAGLLMLFYREFKKWSHETRQDILALLNTKLITYSLFAVVIFFILRYVGQNLGSWLSDWLKEILRAFFPNWGSRLDDIEASAKADFETYLQLKNEGTLDFRGECYVEIITNDYGQNFPRIAIDKLNGTLDAKIDTCVAKKEEEEAKRLQLIQDRDRLDDTLRYEGQTKNYTVSCVEAFINSFSYDESGYKALKSAYEVGQFDIAVQTCMRPTSGGGGIGTRPKITSVDPSDDTLLDGFDANVL